MVKKIDVLMPSSSQYEVLHHFARKLYEAFERQGISCRLLSGDDRIYATLSSPPDFTIGFNGALKMEDGSLFCDHIKVPHVSCLVDPPFRFMELTASPYVIITCDDREGCDLLRARHFERSLFMPHAVDQQLVGDPGVERVYDVVFLGTCIDAEARKKIWKKQLGPNISHLMEEAAQAALKDDHTSFMTVLAKHLDPVACQYAFEEVERYIKGVDRLRLLQAFAVHTVHIFGGGIDHADWKKVLKGQSNLIIHPPVSYDQALEIMKQSKIVLNSSIKNKQGAHERIFTASACGAAVVTNDNPLMREYFKDGEMILYQENNLEQLDEVADKLLKNEKRRLEMSVAGRERVMQGHTWDHRVQNLLSQIPHHLKKMKKS